jgi:SAM-dependent methyltransferase
MKPEWYTSLLPLLRAVDRNYRYARCAGVGWFDGWIIRRSGLTMIPPARLRDRVHGVSGIGRFLRAGRDAGERIEQALRAAGRPIESFKRVLDFGCGCGRILRWFEEYGSTGRFDGSDTDPEAVAWCAAHLPFARFQVNDARPPLAYDDDVFDLVYAISVFTHLDEDRQFAWLEELKRITRPGGTVLLSVLGEGSWPVLRRDERARLDEKGFLYVRKDRWKGVFPDWYQMAYHTPWYVRDQYRRNFEVLSILPHGLSRAQDVVLLRKA